MSPVRSKCSHKIRFLAIGLGLAGLFVQDAQAVVNLTYYLRPFHHDYMSTADYNNERVYVDTWARWTEINSNGNWYSSGDIINGLPDGEQTVFFQRFKNYYLPDPSNHTFSAAIPVLTNLFMPYSNSLSVIVTSAVGAVAAPWQLSGPDEFTNAVSYRTSFTNMFTLTKIPTGSYTVTFSAMVGYTTPSAATTNIAGTPLAGVVTGFYVRATNGVIPIVVNLTNATWTITNYPSDYTNYLSAATLNGTGSTTISNVPVGTYTVRFNPVPGMSTPAAVTHINNETPPFVFTGNYGYGWRLTVYICRLGDPVPPESGFGGTLNYPAGIGYGTYDINAEAKVQGVQVMNDWYFNDGVSVAITATPTNYNDGVNNYTSVYYRGYAKYLYNNDLQYGYSYYTYSASQNPIPGLVMNGSYDVWLLFSRAKNWYENFGDLDADGLPDEWEQTYGLNPESASGTNGAAGNPDEDWIPSASTNVPMRVTVSTNLTTYQAGSGADPGYPLSGTRLYNPLLTANDGYARTNVPFNNLLECRGLDGCYKTNGLGYWVPDDDPRTSPNVFDTFQNKSRATGISDGWRYYFWYWRAKSSYDAGLTNASANLDWVLISPSGARAIGGSDPEYDTDGDGLTDLQEYADGADPTHVDTDGDWMDDKWEITFCGGNSNALNYANALLNPDWDYYALSSNLSVLTTGMVGTAFGDAVCYSGAAANPAGAWVNIYTNTGSNVFDLYLDTILKTTAALTNRQTGTIYTNTVFYGASAGLGAFKQGYPVWVDMNGNSNYDAGDVAIVNPPIKHDAVYLMAPSAPGPGVCSFSPLTAWTNLVTSGTNAPAAAPNTFPYTIYQEYLGGDYFGRLSWDAGGQATAENDSDFVPGVSRDRNSYTLPNNQDSDGDLIPDGWELYVGLNPNSAADTGLDGDGDKLINFDEWANATHPLGTCSGSWSNKFWPTDPGVLTAPSPNDPHPADTDWDGVSDNSEKGLINPNSFDTDADILPDGWEMYAGSNPALADASVDTDGDGLFNWQEYLTGAVAEWMYCDARWDVNFMCRSCMSWDPQIKDPVQPFIPPDFLSCPSFLLANNIITNLDNLRTNYPAAGALGSAEYHTTLANDPDSDWDGMDDFWEVYHGLNPCKGWISLMIPIGDDIYRFDVGFWQAQTGELDAGHNGDARNFQVGTATNALTSLSNLVSYLTTTSLFARAQAVDAMIGPFNCGLNQMDPDADGLPNLEEYSYSSNRPFYHTDPSPFWRTDRYDLNGFAYRNYFQMQTAGFSPLYYLFWPFSMEGGEGFDTDHDGRGDYAEINSAVGETGNDPLDARNPIRNRALFLDGIRDFARTPTSWGILSESYLKQFCAEAWIKPDNPARSGEQVIIERASLCPNPFNQSVSQLSANFKLGITNGLAFIMYNGRGALRVHQATASLSHRIQPGTNWTHIAGVYDGTNLIVYVNGENSASVPTAEIPDNGFDGFIGDTMIVRSSSVIIGAEDTNPAGDQDTTAPRSYFGGCIDEVRVWNGPRSQAEIIANKGQRLPSITDLPLFVYCTFDNVPDPYHRNSAGVLDEPVAPSYMTALDTDMKLHPAITWWENCPNRSKVYTGVNSSYNYIVYAENHAEHVARVPPYDDVVHVNTNVLTNTVSALPAGYKNTTNPYGAQNMERVQMRTDFYLFLGARGVATNSWLGSLDPNNPDSTDSDGDGLPDWWEQLYGLDSNDATGDNGAWGDPDHDGLNNRAEYLAGADPLNSDTYGTGVGDYNYPRGGYSRTYGEMYTDGDGMPDVWESLNGLDPQKYDANLDLDGDGWSNYQEYLAGTNPNDASSSPTPILGGRIKYYGTLTNAAVIITAYQTNMMDGVPAVIARSGQGGAAIAATEAIGMGDGSTRVYSGQLQHGHIVMGSVRVIRFSHMWVCPDYDFGDNAAGDWVLFTDYWSSVPANSYVQFDYISGAYTFTWPTGSPNNWNAPWAGDIISIQYQWQDVSSDTFQVSGLKEGNVYLAGFRDLNNNGAWDAGEPMGRADEQPFYLNWSTPVNMEIELGMADSLPGYGRFTWTAAANTGNYPIAITRLSESGAPCVFNRTMTWSRNYLYEWDYQLQDMYGLTAGTYQWWMNAQHGTFSITWPATVSTPSLIYPRGDSYYYARGMIAWNMDFYSTRYRLQLAQRAADGSYSSISDAYYLAPYRDNDGYYRADLPVYLSDLANGVYYWRLAGKNPQSESAWSDWQTFNVNLSATNSYWVSGDIYYFGKAPATKIIVEAYNNSGFSGQPAARMTLTPSATTNYAKCSYTLRGLQQGSYYVRAFLDVSPAGGTGPDNLLDAWESVGFYRDPNNFYQAGLVNLTAAHFMNNARIIIYDKNTDNDELPDAWEMAWFGNLDQTGDMDYDGDGETNLEEYIKDGVNQNPTAWDTDGDGLADGFESQYNGAAFGFARNAHTVAAALNPNVRDTDGDGYSDGAELLRYHTDPLDPTSYPYYRPLCTDAWPSPGDYDADGRSDLGVYDFNAGVWSLLTMALQYFDWPFGFTQAQPMVADYDGDGRTDFSFYDNGLWTIYFTQSGQSASGRFGDASMTPAPGDYDGDHRADLATYDTDSGVWYIYNIWNGSLITGKFGDPGMIPAPGDYNGDGATDFGVYEPATGNWTIGCYHKYYHTWTVFSGALGGPTWMPVPGDYDGDGRSDICLFEESTGNWMLFTLAGQFLQGGFGWPGCVPAPGDYDGDGRTDPAIYDTNTGVWYIYCWSGAYYQGGFGGPGAMPILKGR